MHTLKFVQCCFGASLEASRSFSHTSPGPWRWLCNHGTRVGEVAPGVSGGQMEPALMGPPALEEAEENTTYQLHSAPTLSPPLQGS